MENPPEIYRMRSVLAALIAGNIQHSEFEQVVRTMIAAGSLTRADVRCELNAAMAKGVLRTDSLHRLCLNESAAPPTVFRPTSAPASKQNRNTGDTIIRPATASPSRVIQSTPPTAETESNWVDPDSLAASGTVTTGQLLGGRYLLERVLGEGGMGVVYMATDQEVKGETFAIKVLKSEIRDQPESWGFLREEVRKTRALHHPNIAGVYSLNSDSTGIYMLMEYLEGKTLNALIDEDFGRGMPLMRAWPLINDIGAALAYAHDHSVIHSDLKPSNVIVTTSAKAKLLDFGIARAVRGGAGRFDPSVLGALTPSYASCEMLEGRPPDQSDDVYAFGCVIYEMLSGKHPFDQLSALEACAKGLRPSPIASLTSSQNQALAHALAFERADRTATVEALLSGLEGSQLEAIPERRRPRLIWPAIGVALIVIGGASAWFFSPMSLFARRSTETTESSVVPSATPAPAPPIEPSPEAPQEEQAQPSTLPKASPEQLQASLPAQEPATTSEDQGAVRKENISSNTTRQSNPPTSVVVPPIHQSTPASRQDDLTKPPVGKNIPRLKPAPNFESFADSCPYPAEALAQGETGEVGLLIHVAPDGTVLDTQIDTSSGSDVLDQAAARCAKDNGHFLPKNTGLQKAGYWGRMKFNWSFGE
jgi:TonB family protein